MLICENNRLKYTIDKKNHDIARVVEQIRDVDELSKKDIINLLEGIVDRVPANDGAFLSDENGSNDGQSQIKNRGASQENPSPSDQRN